MSTIPSLRVSIRQELVTFIRIDVSIMMALAPASAVTSTIALMTALVVR